MGGEREYASLERIPLFLQAGQFGAGVEGFADFYVHRVQRLDRLFHLALLIEHLVLGRGVAIEKTAGKPAMALHDFDHAAYRFDVGDPETLFLGGLDAGVEVRGDLQDEDGDNDRNHRSHQQKLLRIGEAVH